MPDSGSLSHELEAMLTESPVEAATSRRGFLSALLTGTGLLGGTLAGGLGLGMASRSALALDLADGWTARGTTIEAQHGEVESLYFGDASDDDWLGLNWTGFNQDTTDIEFQILLRGVEDGDAWSGGDDATEFEILASSEITVTGTSGEEEYTWADVFGEPLPVDVDDHSGIDVTEDFSIQGGECPRGRELEVRLYVDVLDEDLTVMKEDTGEIQVTSHTGNCPGFEIAVTTEGTTDVDNSSARLLGELDQLEGFNEATVSFEWGEAGSGLENSTTEQTLNEPASFDAAISGLEDDTSYEFRAVAEAGSDSAVGATMTFQTPPEGTDPPTIDQFDVIGEGHNVHARALVEWTVSSTDADIDQVTSSLYRNDTLEDSVSEHVGSSGASGEHELEAHQGAGEEYEVVLEVVDTLGYVTTETQLVTL